MIWAIFVSYLVSIASCSSFAHPGHFVVKKEHYPAPRYIRGTYGHSSYKLNYLIEDEIASEQSEYLPEVEYNGETTLSRFQRQTYNQFGSQQGGQGRGQLGGQQGRQFGGQGRSFGGGGAQVGQGSFQSSSFGGGSQVGVGQGQRQQGQAQQRQVSPGGDNLAIAMGLISQLEPNFQGILYINVL